MDVVNRVQCSWCKKILRDGCEPISHGICPECLKDFFQKGVKNGIRADIILQIYLSEKWRNNLRQRLRNTGFCSLSLL